MLDIEKYNHINYTLKPNYQTIPVTQFNINDEGAHKFNEIIDYIKENNITNLIQRTPSGGIHIDTKLSLLATEKYDITYRKNSAEITLLSLKGCYRFQFRTELPNNEDKGKISGSTAFKVFKNMLLKDGIDLDKYKIDNGAEVKETIEPPLIKLEKESYRDIIFNNANHIDFHNSYPAGLINTHPEFKNVIETCYNKRKENPIYKNILNFSIGYMQSLPCCNAKWAHLSKDAIADNNKRIRELTIRLKAAGRIIISYNTDGIWYQGKPFHGKGEGSTIGKWENDHINCKFRAKSAGAYEFIENDKYKAVVRGTTKLDLIKNRDLWEWGDIYSQEASEELKYVYIDGEGIYRDGKKL